MKKSTVDKPVRIGHKNSVTEISLIIFSVIYVIGLFVPFIWSAITSVKTPSDFYNNPFGLPEKWMFSNYGVVLKNFTITATNPKGQKVLFNFGDMLMNSVSYSLLSAFVATTTTYIMAYATTMFSKYKFSKVVEAVTLVCMSLPMVGSLPATIKMVKALGIYENFVPFVIVTKMNFLSMHFFIIGKFIKGIPPAYKEAAQIDGANNLQLLFRVYFPLTISIYLTCMLLSFLDFWQDFGTMFVFLKNFPTASYGLYYFKGQTSGAVTHISMKFAASLMVTLPLILIFIFAHKPIMKGISLSDGVKE